MDEYFMIYVTHVCNNALLKFAAIVIIDSTVASD